jgi:3D (Asp-Asp-Asp) domain-containing protein
VYIYQANRDIIDDPNMIKVGTKVRIPDKEEFSSGLSSKGCIDKAHAIAAEVYAKYKQH